MESIYRLTYRYIDVNDDNITQDLKNIRSNVAAKVRELRTTRRLTQADLARRLGLSQSRLSEIERGQGSFSAEQFLVLLKLFNVTAAEFSKSHAPNKQADLQNALARLGAAQLRESEQIIASEHFDDVNRAIHEALVDGSPRLVTATAPVIVQQVDRVHLPKVEARLAEVGLQRRLLWAVDNVLDALHREIDTALPRDWAKRYRRAAVVLGVFGDAARLRFTDRDVHTLAPDILDAEIRTKRTLDSVRASSSPVSLRWGIVTELQPDDFRRALRAAREGR
jgi:transcriptional regulator with XRE-family HTH domain